MVTSAMFAAIPQRWISRIEWFQVLVRTDDLCFTMNLKTLKTVEYFLLEMILKNMFETFWSTFLFVLEVQWKWPDCRWYFNEMLAKPMDFRHYSTKIFFKIISSKKYSTVFNVFRFIVKLRSSGLTSTWNHSIRVIHRWDISSRHPWQKKHLVFYY